MALNSESILIEAETVVMYNDPLLLCAEDSIQNDCALVFKTIKNDIVTNSTLIFEPSVYQIDKEHSENISTRGYNIAEKLSFHFEKEVTEGDQDLNMVNFFYKNVPKDQPEFVDINNLTDPEYVESINSVKETFVVSDDENDVIFVKEYKKEENIEETVIFDVKNDLNDERIRRNPVRKARTNKGRRHLQKEHLLEEDFAFLDQIDEENLVLRKSKSSSSTTSATSSVNENFKEWPENCYERPEFNSQTNKIEPFDFTIREIQNNQQKKKSRLETCTKVKRKPKKKYFIRKRKPKAKRAEKKIPVNELQHVVGLTFDLVESYIHTVVDNDTKLEKSVFKRGLYNLLRNQTALMAVVNNYSEQDVAKCVKKLLDES